ncbi:hypothetical protein BH23BAC1_BH23BAC1_04230 [soil metagenome]
MKNPTVSPDRKKVLKQIAKSILTVMENGISNHLVKPEKVK